MAHNIPFQVYLVTQGPEGQVVHQVSLAPLERREQQEDLDSQVLLVVLDLVVYLEGQVQLVHVDSLEILAYLDLQESVEQQVLPVSLAHLAGEV